MGAAGRAEKQLWLCAFSFAFRFPLGSRRLGDGPTRDGRRPGGSRGPRSQDRTQRKARRKGLETLRLSLGVGHGLREATPGPRAFVASSASLLGKKAVERGNPLQAPVTLTCIISASVRVIQPETP